MTDYALGRKFCYRPGSSTPISQRNPRRVPLPPEGFAMASQTLSDRLRAAVESRHCRHHPYYELWRKGTLSREAIAGWVQEHYHFTKDIPWLLGPMLTEVPYPDVREMFRHNVEEETDPKD